MKKTLVVLNFLLLLITAFVSISEVRATEELWVTYSLPEDVPLGLMPNGYTTEDYLNTTNPYLDGASIQGALDEVDDAEGNYPLYVLVCGDEEERACVRRIGPEGQYPVSYDKWAEMQIERGDEALVANFGIDIRILGFLEWDSNDNSDSMYDLWYELEEDAEQHLGQWYDGEWWSDYVDAIIGITDQETPGDSPPIAGLAPPPSFLDQGRIFVLLKWQCHWVDDNLVQHEVSHLYYADDHYDNCCAMAYHTHFQTWILEDGFQWVFTDVPCAYTSYSWCINCQGTIQQNRGRYVLRTLTISASSGGTTNPPPGSCDYDHGSPVTATAYANSYYVFNYWLLDGSTLYQNPITVTMDADHALTAYFSYSGGGPGGGECPTLFVWNGTGYVSEGLLNIHAESDITVQHEAQNTLALKGWVYSLELRELDNFTSHIDQVKLYAVDDQGEWHLSPLAYANHSELGWVTWKLRFDDESRVDMTPTQSIDLRFLPSIPYNETAYFVFEINGHNRKALY